MISITYNIDDDIIYLNRTGKIFVEDIIDSIYRINEEFQNKKLLRIINDTRGSQTEHDHYADLDLIINTIKSMIKKYDLVKSAIIVDDPRDTAISLIYELISKEIDNYHIKIFTTINAGKSWLI